MAPALRLLGPAEFRSSPWRNGGGVTRELAIHPPGATVDGPFDWRLSMAEVACSGPFSRFEGTDRSLLLLDGDGLDLDFGPHGRQRLVNRLEPIAFPGEWACTGSLLGGPCRDFNVMTRRMAYGHRLEVARSGAILAAAPVLLVYSLAGPCRLGGWEIPEGHLLRIDGGTESLRLLGPPTTVALVVGFAPTH